MPPRRRPPLAGAAVATALLVVHVLVGRAASVALGAVTLAVIAGAYLGEPLRVLRRPFG